MQLGLSLGLNRTDKRSGSAFSSSVTYVNGGTTTFAGSDATFAATSTAIDDWMFVVADGTNATNVIGGSGAAWTKLTITRIGDGRSNTLFYRKLIAGDAGATFTTTGGSNAGPLEWIAYRGVVSVGTPQTQASVETADSLTFNAPSVSPLSGRFLAVLSQHDGSTGAWSPPNADWNTRVSWGHLGPKWLGDILSSTYAGGPITFTSPVSTPTLGEVGWLFELVGT